MAWQSVAFNALYYLFLPLSIFFKAVYRVLLAALAPVYYLLTYLLHALLLPLQIVRKLETLYIYFGVAALIGVLAGCVLHFTSRIIVSVLDLQTVRDEEIRSAVSLEDRKGLEEALNVQPRVAEDLVSEYADLMKKESGKRRGSHGLLSQTILEEEDDSEDGF